MGSNKSNGLADWILINAVVRTYKQPEDKVSKFKGNPWIRLVQVVCRFNDKQQLPEREMYPSDIVEWMWNVAVEDEMTIITLSSEFPSDEINWSRHAGFFKIVQSTSESFNSIMHMRSRKVEKIDDERVWCNEPEVGIQVYVENAWDEMGATLRI